MERPPTLRSARAEDVPQLVAVLVSAELAGRPARGRTRSDGSIAYELRERLLPTADVVVAERGGDVAGFVAVRDGELVHLHVDPEAQGRSVGRALVGRALELGGVGLRAVVPTDDARTVAFLGARGFVWEADVEVDGAPAVELRGPGPEPAWW